MQPNSLPKFFAVLLLFGIGACKKTEIHTVLPDNQAGSGPRFYITGPSTLVLDDSTTIGDKGIDTISYKYEIKADSGFQKKIFVDIPGIPGTVWSRLSQKEGIPPFSTELSLNILLATAGRYPFSLLAYSEGDSSKTLPVDLLIKRDMNCAGRLVGNGYTTKTIIDWVSGQVNATNVSITPSPAGQNKVYLYDVLAKGDTMEATIDCIRHRISLPQKNLYGPPYYNIYGQDYFSGYGSFYVTKDSIRLSIQCRLTNMYDPGKVNITKTYARLR